jgi:DegV family protein with EDD domain
VAGIKIVTDSTADIPPAWVQDLGITVIPCEIVFGQEVFLEGVDLTNREFYDRMASDPVLPITSQPPLGMFGQAYKGLGDEQDTEAIVSIHISSLLSGAYHTACVAASSLPDLNIIVIDSRQLSMGLGWLVITAARMAQEGHAAAQIAAVVKEMIPRVRAITMLDSLLHVARGGRIGKAKALMGTLLKVKPLVQVLDGEVSPICNVRTRRRALVRLVEIVAAQQPFEEMSVLHADAPDAGREVLALLIEALNAAGSPFDKERILFGQSGASITTHLGIGAVGICCVLAKITNCDKER